MTHHITSPDELDALHDDCDVLLRASGCYSAGNAGPSGRFTDCWVRPLPAHLTSEPTWEVLVFGETWPSNLVTTKDIDLPATVLFRPGTLTPTPAGDDQREALAAIIFGGLAHRRGRTHAEVSEIVADEVLAWFAVRPSALNVNGAPFRCRHCGGGADTPGGRDHHLTTCCPSAPTEADVQRRIAAAVEVQRQMDLAMHEAYRPEVVAEVAVQLSDSADWNAIATWCGGTISSGQDPSGEYTSSLHIPGVGDAWEGSWIVQRHDLSFGIRAVVEGPSAPTVTTNEQVEHAARAWHAAAEDGAPVPLDVTHGAGNILVAGVPAEDLTEVRRLRQQVQSLTVALASANDTTEALRTENDQLIAQVERARGLTREQVLAGLRASGAPSAVPSEPTAYCPPTGRRFGIGSEETWSGAGS